MLSLTLRRAAILAGLALMSGVAPAQIVEPTLGKAVHPLNGAANPESIDDSVKKAQVYSTITGYGIQYHGGPVMNASTTTVYYIWYGSWSGNSATTILQSFVKGLSGSPYFNINTTYSSSSGAVKNSVTFGGFYNDSYSQGKSLSDTAIQTIVSNAVTGGHLPLSKDAVYFVLTSADVNETSGFCTQYCGWHTNGTISGLDIKYSFVGNPDRCPSACEAQSSKSPNNNPGADGMASIIAHELSETVSDPDGNAWWRSSNGYENGDLCAWNFGTTHTASNGSAYNVSLGGSQYLIQQMWLNAVVNGRNGGCALSH